MLARHIVFPYTQCREIIFAISLSGHVSDILGDTSPVHSHMIDVAGMIWPIWVPMTKIKTMGFNLFVFHPLGFRIIETLKPKLQFVYAHNYIRFVKPMSVTFGSYPFSIV